MAIKEHRVATRINNELFIFLQKEMIRRRKKSMSEIIRIIIEDSRRQFDNPWDTAFKRFNSHSNMMAKILDQQFILMEIMATFIKAYLGRNPLPDDIRTNIEAGEKYDHLQEETWQIFVESIKEALEIGGLTPVITGDTPYTQSRAAMQLKNIEEAFFDQFPQDKEITHAEVKKFFHIQQKNI